MAPAATTFTVQGMHCAGCAQRLRTALGRLDGILTTDPDHQTGRVTVRFDPDRVAADALAQRLGDAGFQVLAVAPAPTAAATAAPTAAPTPTDRDGSKR
jgi:copper chaperone CopZ